MQAIMLKSKLHKARVTAVEKDYEGSMAIDRDLMDHAKIHPFEKILVANLANGERFETYAIPAENGSGKIGLNGATSFKGAVGDELIIFTFGLVQEEEAKSHKPLILILNAENKAPDGLKEI